MIPTLPSEWPLRGRFHCVDPVTLTGLALAGATGAAGGFFGSQASKPAATTPPPTPTPPPAPPPPAQQPQERATAAATRQPTFLGSAAVPQQSGSKTLLGQ